jgi:hypothetical protein
MVVDLNEFYEKNKSDSCIISFLGNITPESISSTMQNLEENLETLHEIPKIRKKIYNVLLECFQNLFHHSHEIITSEIANKPLSVCIVDKSEDCYSITTGNYIKKDKIEKFKSHLEKINQLSKEDLRIYYMEILDNGEKSEKDGAGLGMIDILRKSGGKLYFHFSSIDDNYSLFSLTIQILK